MASAFPGSRRGHGRPSNKQRDKTTRTSALTEITPYKYLAEAWRLANGNLCRALMKYRAGWGEERLSPLSQEYCRRARVHLANIGSPLAGATPAGLMDPAELARLRTAPLFPAQAGGLPASGSRVLSKVEVAWANALKRAQARAVRARHKDRSGQPAVLGCARGDDPLRRCQAQKEAGSTPSVVA